jgi:hypothetical protein
MKYIVMLVAALFAASVNMAPAMADSDKKGYEKSEKHEKGDMKRDREHSQRDHRDMERDHERERERDADREHRDMKDKSSKKDDGDEKGEKKGWWPF